MRWTCLWLAFLVLAFVPAHAGHSPPKVALRVHVQTTGDGMSAQEATTITLPPNGERIQVRTLPELTELQLVDVQQDANGLHLQFDHAGTATLNAVTAQNQGRILVVFIDGVIVYAPEIDEQIDTGRLTIPHPVPPQILGFLQDVVKMNLRQAART
jgi:preprotein translocase subunit SecD